MSEKVLGFYGKDAIACIWRNMNTNNKFVIMKTEGNTIDKNDERKVNLVPVRLASESVDLKKLKEKIKKEWKEHKENWSKDGEWFECNNVETDAYNNYSVGASITTTYADGREKTIILKTKKEADAYSKKQKKKFWGCSVCDRFESLLSWAEKEAKKQAGEK